MKLGILSDTHFGYGWDTPLENDSFIQAEEGIQALLKEGVDAILHAGDIFHSSIPRPEIMARAIHVLSEARDYEPSEKISSYIGRNPPRNKPVGVPIIAIHGTHERRPKGMVNPIQLLERAGILIHLHMCGVVLNNKVAIYGMGGVPERYALNVLQTFGPKPISKSNIFLMHQLIKEIFNPPNEPATIGLEDLPHGFVTICGHIHWPGKRSGLFLPGSTIRTQMGKAEPNEKKVYVFSEDGSIKEIELKTPRSFFYETVSAENKSPQEVVEECNELLKKLKPDGRAVVRLKLVGQLKQGYETRDLKLDDLQKQYTLLYIEKSIGAFEQLPELPQGSSLEDLLVNAVEKAIASRGLKIDAKAVCQYLLSNKIDKVMEVLFNDSQGAPMGTYGSPAERASTPPLHEVVVPSEASAPHERPHPPEGDGGIA